jgi:glycerol kinase
MSRTKEPWVLALDQGGHASRALVFADDGREIVRAEVPVATRYPRTGWVEHEPAALLESISTCIRLIGEALGTDVRRIGMAALATQRSSLICWSRKDGTALSPVLSWQDVRAAALLDELAPDPAEIHAITGLRISPHYGASKLRWCLAELPAVRAAAARGDLAGGPLASWLVFALSGGQCFAVDPCNASRTLLWDVRSRDWSPRLLDFFDIPRAILPQCQANRAVWATLPVGDCLVPLMVVTGDQSAVPYAFDTPSAGEAFLTLGTGAFVQQIEGTAPTPCAGLLNSVVWQDGDAIQYALEGTVNGAGAALTWFAETERIAEADILAALPAWLAAVRDPPLFINAIGGLAAPFWKSHGRSEFVGTSDLAGRAVAVIESIAFLLQANLEAMREGGRPVRKLVAVGGLARLDGLLERIAALSDVPVFRAAHGEATAYGAARLAGAGLPPLATSPPSMPDAQLKAALESRYRRSLEIWRAL